MSKKQLKKSKKAKNQASAKLVKPIEPVEPIAAPVAANHVLPESNTAKAIAILGYLQVAFGMFLLLTYLASAVSARCSSVNQVSVFTIGLAACVLQVASLWLIVWLVRGLNQRTSAWYYTAAIVVPLLLSLVSLFGAIGISFTLGSACDI